MGKSEGTLLYQREAKIKVGLDWREGRGCGGCGMSARRRSVFQGLSLAKTWVLIQLWGQGLSWGVPGGFVRTLWVLISNPVQRASFLGALRLLNVFPRCLRQTLSLYYQVKRHHLLLPLFEGGGGFPGGSAVKDPTASARDASLIPGLGRSSGECKGNLLQHSCLGNPMDKGAYVYSPWGCKELDMT